MNEYFPPVNVLLNLEPEEISQYLLLYLNNYVSKNHNVNKINRFNLISSSNPELMTYANNHSDIAGELLSQAWFSLLVRGLIAPIQDEHNMDWVFITKNGQKIKNKADFAHFSYIKLLPKDLLDIKLAEKVWPIFIRGDFDTSVFAAFKEVEVRMRNAADLPATIFGVDLARDAFNSEKGKLTDIENPNKSEKEAYGHLFAGAIGAFKNPSSHRDIDYDDPAIASSLILFANTLLSIIDKRGNEYKRIKKLTYKNSLKQVK